ncbi:MAG: matrixin family metalloprotease [Deltaproteobacteria bacterium]|nr:matrixin family metalloprotease [Deltaproteobacteria bacterium]
MAVPPVMRLALLMLALVACGHSKPLHVMPAPDAHRATARFLDALEATPGGAGIFVLGVDPPYTIWIRAACGTQYDREITVAPCGPYPENIDNMAVIVGHELGHALGLKHSVLVDSIMYERGAATGLTVEDAAASLVRELSRAGK